MTPYPRIRIFKSDFLEKFSTVHPATPAILFIPWVIITSLLYIPLSISNVTNIVFGFYLWGLFEYLIHRFLYHLPIPLPKAELFKSIIHGIHHDDPKDPLRLVAPPALSLSIGGLISILFYLLLPASSFWSILNGFTCGYLSYDYLHWWMHHRKFKLRYLLSLQRHHALHHFNPDKNFGVSTMIWDKIFKTIKNSTCY